MKRKILSSRNVYILDERTALRDTESCAVGAICINNPTIISVCNVLKVQGAILTVQGVIHADK